MADEAHPENKPEGKQPDAFTQQIQHEHVSARVPEKVGRGVFSNGILVIQGAQEFVLDFTQRVAKPHQVVARVILPPGVVGSLIGALDENVKRYTSVFGPVPSLLRQPPPEKPPSVADIYETLKLPDEMLSGVYANAAMISHTQTEFCFDFITNVYPRSAVSCRVYLAAPNVPGMLQSLSQSFRQFQEKIAQQQHRRPPEPPHG